LSREVGGNEQLSADGALRAGKDRHVLQARKADGQTGDIQKWFGADTTSAGKERGEKAFDRRFEQRQGALPAAGKLGLAGPSWVPDGTAEDALPSGPRHTVANRDLQA
jgi:hypothetical protein